MHGGQGFKIYTDDFMIMCKRTINKNKIFLSHQCTIKKVILLHIDTIINVYVHMYIFFFGEGGRKYTTLIGVHNVCARVCVCVY